VWNEVGAMDFITEALLIRSPHTKRGHHQIIFGDALLIKHFATSDKADVFLCSLFCCLIDLVVCKLIRLNN
jgi:hypothetical protein